MTQIILARHGRPTLNLQTIPGHGLAGWLQHERDAPLDGSSGPSPALQLLAKNARCLIASPLRRSQDSARLLSPETPLIIEEDVREAALPSAFRSALLLHPGMWTSIARFRWFFGWSDGEEGFNEATRRAGRAARMLELRAHELEGDIVVVGHGLMNVFIARQLRSLGWHGPRFPSPRHWSFGIYTY